jgi:signal transduction histidine kinase
MARSLRGRLILLLGLLIGAALASALVMVGLFEQSATARIGQADALVGRSCDAIGEAYHFFVAGWHGPSATSDDAALRRNLVVVVQTALRNRTDIEGGIWQAQAGSVAYAFPTYQGSGPKTDVPQAELPQIQAINAAAAVDGRLAGRRYDAPSQTLLLAACPLPGPLAGLTAWTMTRVHTFAGGSYLQLMAGLGVLLAAVLAAVALCLRLTVTWSRHVGRIETALDAHDIADLPVLPSTGERELDRIVRALNEAGRRLAVARQRAETQSRQVATSERLAAIGRVAAGVAHEIRNPIAAMRLRAESAIAGGAERQRAALAVIIEQVDRLDGLMRRLLNVTERDEPRPSSIAVRDFLARHAEAYAEIATNARLSLAVTGTDDRMLFDPDLIGRALDNLILNAVQAAPPRSVVRIDGRHVDDWFVLAVHDDGPGPPADLADHLFEPFVTGRAGGTGLGLSIVQEAVDAHGGQVSFSRDDTGTLFEMRLPWR